MKINDIDSGKSFDFGRTSSDYAKYRDIYPQSMYEKLVAFGDGKKGQRILDLGSPQYCILHWLGILLNFREFDTLNSRAYQARDYIRTAFAISQQNYDCIIGPSADNVNFTFAQAFLNGEISYRLLRESVRSSGPDRQFVLRSNRAFDRLLFTGYDTVKSIRESPARISREHKALRHLAHAMSAGPGRKSSPELYIAQIMDENIREYDPRLR